MTCRILVGWDGSDPADVALEAAITYAREIGGEVEVLAVFDRRRPVSDKESSVPSAPERGEVREKFSQRFGETPVKFHAVVDSASPALVLAQFAQDRKFDLIAVGKSSSWDHRDGDQTLLELTSCTTTPLMVVKPDRPIMARSSEEDRKGRTP